MRKILFHAGMLPMEHPSMHRIFNERLFTTNSGNLVFQFGAYRTLLTDDVEMLPLFMDQRRFLTDEVIDRVNGTCSCAVLPMANNFREGYSFKILTTFIQRMKIPCVVAGIGLQAKDLAQIREGFPFDDEVKTFVKAVLDHSAMLGLRGELTGEYLKKLGFIPEKHFTVTGCPSMYSRGLRLPEPRVKPLTDDSRVSINYRKEQPDNLLRFMQNNMRRLPNYSLLVQRVEEMHMMRYGRPLVYEYGSPDADLSAYPMDLSHPAVREGRMYGFTSAYAWIKHLEQVDFSIGCRIHGNIVSVLAGTPALVLTIDTRTEELCRYHGIPYIPADQISGDTDIRDLYERTDFSSPQRGHEQRFRHFVDFLNANGLEHIYKDTLEPERVPLDEALKGEDARWGTIRSAARIPIDVALEGTELYLRRRFRERVLSPLRARRR